jgi:hypothetical protein
MKTKGVRRYEITRHGCRCPGSSERLCQSGRFPASQHVPEQAAAQQFPINWLLRQRVMMLLQDAQSQHAEANQGQCIMTLQQAEKIVRQGTGTS